MFTNDIILWKGKDYFGDGEIVKIARYFVVGVVIVAYLLSLVLMKTASVFNLGMWCFAVTACSRLCLPRCTGNGPPQWALCPLR